MQQNLATNTYKTCFTRDLKPGQIVYEDVYVENRRLLAKGHVLTERIISLLRNRNVQQVLIEKTATNMGNSLKSFTKEATNPISMDIRHDYLRALGQLSSETRYGKLLNNAEDIQLLAGLFTSYLENPTVYKLLSNLKNHDEATYLHSIDVFTLGTLFAISEGIITIEEVGLGFLFHDIGKLYTASELLKKVQKLTKNEYAVIQYHAMQGYEILHQHGLAHIAHFAKSHHERVDGSGYPEGLEASELSIELQILQLVDVYSALTMDRPYHPGDCAVIALEKLFKKVSQFNAGLLYRFIDFVGIYPENAIVLLSDGSQAIIQQVNTLYPLLPTVKIFNTGNVLHMPMDFSLSIHKLITFHVDSPQDLFSKFSDFLLNNDVLQMRRYYEKLKQHYPQNEWFSHIYLPVFHVFRVIENYEMVPEMRFKEVKSTLVSLLEDTLKLFRKSDHAKKKFILLLGDIKKPAVIKLFEGLLHSQNIYSFISPANQSKEAIEKLVKLCSVDSLILVSEQFINMPTLDIQYYHLTEFQLESFMSHYVSTSIEHQQLIDDLQRFNKTEHLLFIQ
ncbi:HD domain-containing phosphohydrolase [Solibacillus sp.]|uniref:HD-GYP domain-containing protein n=1 Tax=Solibacillus sp. TaxID=1909654 RepID=UPI00331482F3